ncbi:LPP20 family lipoprotein [Veronia pacifica]|uniref:Flagellar biosynthesis protein FlgP n=1 Tax=Veronia pacifica TaxID=1080227 RepID=A0A1C3EEN8_9GAMM|nr:LPP20 family lipoprotein [Veronia pacifica]ODA31705.1 flagellar biosynthesis protein FlgP [Veronia pacifica]
MSKWFLLVTAIFLTACQPLTQMHSNEVLSAVGSASISAQDGRTIEEKRFKAMKASKLEAYRELSEQVYGYRVSGEMEVDRERLGVDRVDGAVDGVIRGAEVLSSYPVGDTYVTEMQLDLSKMKKMMAYGDVQSVPKQSTVIF